MLWRTHLRVTTIDPILVYSSTDDWACDPEVELPAAEEDVLPVAVVVVVVVLPVELADDDIDVVVGQRRWDPGGEE